MKDGFSMEQALQDLGLEVYTDPARRLVYGFDASPLQGEAQAVVFPRTLEEIQRLVQWAGKHRVPLVPRGAGTGLAGGAVPHTGGVVVAMTRWRRVHQLHPKTRFLETDIGLTNLEIDRLAARYGLHYPPDPSSQRVSLIGGNLATNAGGPRCFKYGVTAAYVLGLEGVAGRGEVVRFGGPVYDAPDLALADLWIGSEGTLGIVTRVWLRLVPRPSAVRTLRVAFPSLEDAGRAVSAVVAAGLVPAALEVMDRQMVNIVEAAYHLGLPTEAGALLLLEVDGAEPALEPQIEAVIPLLLRHRGYDLRLARSEAERAALWKARKSAAGAFARLAPAFYLADVAVPRTRMAAMFAAMDRLAQRQGLTVAYLAHAGDGNLHARIAVPRPDDADLWRRVWETSHAWLRQVLGAEGTIPAEHGVGLEKRKALAWMYGGNELQAMAQVKAVFDPQNIFNPGKVLPEPLPQAQPVSSRPLPPGGILRPETPEEAAGWLRACGEGGKRVRIVEKANAPPALENVCLLGAPLQGEKRLALEDLFLTVPAGTPLAQVHRALQETPFFLPLASPWPKASIGALLSMNVNPPSRSRYGGWREHLLALEAVLADGRVLRLGRPVVKDVAGYALPRAFVGLRGALGLITRVTLKVHPRPRSRRTWSWWVDGEDEALLSQALGLARRMRLASAWLLLPAEEELRLVYTAEGWPQDVDAETRQVLQAARALGWGQPHEEDNPGEEVWRTVLAHKGAWLLRVGLPLDRWQAGWRASRSWRRGAWVLDVLHGLLYVTTPPKGAGPEALTQLAMDLADLGGYVYPLRVPKEAAEAAASAWPRAAVRWWEDLRRHWDPHAALIPPWEPLHWMAGGRSEHGA